MGAERDEDPDELTGADTPGGREREGNLDELAGMDTPGGREREGNLDELAGMDTPGGREREGDPDELTGVDTPGGRRREEDPDETAGADIPGEGDELDDMDEPLDLGEPHALEDEDEDEDDEFDAEREETGESVTIEIAGLSLYTHHGVSEAEREVGQRIVLDLRLDLGETDATVTDSIEDTVDYGEVCQLVALIAQQRSHKTLERLCGTIADRLLGDYELEGVWVKATKPEPPIALPVDEVSVEVWREAEE